MKNPNWNTYRETDQPASRSKLARLHGFAKLPDPSTCTVCGKKAIYMYAQIGACSQHKDSLRPAAEKTMRRRDANYSDRTGAYECQLDKNFHASHAKKGRSL